MKVHKEMTNIAIAELLKAVGAAYELKSGKEFNRFRVVAYQNAATAIEHLTQEVKEVWEEGKLDGIPGVGKGIAKYLDELFRTGKVKHFESLFKNLPPGFFDLLKLSGIGAKTAYKLVKELDIKGEDVLAQVEKAAKAGKIRGVPGFGKGREKLILESIQEHSEKKHARERMLMPIASVIADGVLLWIRKNPKVARAEALGSLRRGVSTVGDIDVAVVTNDPKDVIEHFSKYPKVQKVIEAGPHSSSILLEGGVQVDLMVQPPDAFGALLAHFTGSKHHNIALREYALKKGMSLSEYGIKTKVKSDERSSSSIKLKVKSYNSKLKIYQFPTEEEFYGALELEWIPPEIREDTGEIDASLNHTLPDLLELKDIKGDLHLHSDFPIHTSHDQGTASFREMLELAEKLDYEYLGFSEHNPAQSTNSEKQIVELIKHKSEAIEKLNYSNEKVKRRGVKRVFNGLEIDILPSGRLAVPDEGLELLDYAIVSVHSSFRQNKKEQTKRVISGLSHPKAKIFGHPTARRLNKREGIDLDWDTIFSFCEKHNKWLEINSWYDRLDLPDTLVREAVKHGIIMIVNTDSHQLDHMHLMRYGVTVARRGWAEKENIANAQGFERFVKEFSK